MSATDELRRMLDERGVEYEAYRDIKNRCITRWRTYHGAFAFFAVEKEGELFVETASDTEHSAICTPEQTIAATLGNGKLTAEQVEEAVYRNCKFYEGGEVDVESIADELNAALGNENTSRYDELFGTPERAARTLEIIADNLYSSTWSDDNATLSDVMCALVGKCDECVAQGLPGRGVTTKCGEVDYDKLLDWLRGDA